MKIYRAFMTILPLAAILGVGATAASAQEPVGWLPWVGCWNVTGAPEGEALCVAPTDVGSVELLRYDGSELVAREVLWSDGARHETNREGCDGWEQGRFSEDGRRIFYSSEHACEGEGVRTGSGVMSLTGDGTWLDVRAMDVAGEPTAWVQRYTPAPIDPERTPGLAEYVERRRMSVRAARAAAAAPLDVADVVEATRHLPTEAVEAWVAQTGDEFDLTAEQLVALDDAGVDGSVIDVMVAVSFPRRFALQGQDIESLPSARGAASAVGFPGGYERCARTAFGWDPFYRYGYRGRGCSYARYGYGYGFGYSPYGYGYGYGNGYGYGYYRPVIVERSPRSDGRAVPGRGYTRSGSGGSKGQAYPAGGGSRASGGGTSSGGSSAAPASGSTGRKATPRKAKRRGGGEA